MKKRAKPKPKRRGRKAAPTVAAARRPSSTSAARGVPTPMTAVLKTSRSTPVRAAASAQTFARNLSSEDRSVFALLLLPFLIVAVSLTMAQSRRGGLLALPSLTPAPVERVAIAPAPSLPRPPLPLPPPLPEIKPAPAPSAPASIPAELPRPDAAPVVAMPLPPLAFPPPAPVIEREPASAQVPPPASVASIDREAASAPSEQRAIEAPLTRPLFPPPLAVLEPEKTPAAPASPVAVPADTAPASSGNTTVASLDVAKPMLPPASPPTSVAPPPAPTAEDDGICTPTPERSATFGRVGRMARAQLSARPVGLNSEELGRRLADAALAQTKDLVIYTARYQPMAYPLGDVMPLYGACIDVVIRAYRTLGVDLQEEVQRSRSGRGDTNIDHRRTDNVRRFFERSGASLPVTSFPEDYKPGDIVTYHRPFSRVSTSHIAIVTGILAPTGRPMIVHNRGYGPQLEDALFVDRITGHYRYRGPLQQPRSTAAAPASGPASDVKASTPPPVRAARAPGPQTR